MIEERVLGQGGSEHPACYRLLFGGIAAAQLFVCGLLGGQCRLLGELALFSGADFLADLGGGFFVAIQQRIHVAVFGGVEVVAFRLSLGRIRLRCWLLASGTRQLFLQAQALGALMLQGFVHLVEAGVRHHLGLALACQLSQQFKVRLFVRFFDRLRLVLVRNGRVNLVAAILVAIIFVRVVDQVVAFFFLLFLDARIKQLGVEVVVQRLSKVVRCVLVAHGCPLVVVTAVSAFSVQPSCPAPACARPPCASGRAGSPWRGSAFVGLPLRATCHLA